MNTPREWEEDIVKFVMETTNGIDDYNWGQDKFEKDIREMITKALTSSYEQGVRDERERIKGIETWRCTDMGANNDDYVVVRKFDLQSPFPSQGEETKEKEE